MLILGTVALQDLLVDVLMSLVAAASKFGMVVAVGQLAQVHTCRVDVCFSESLSWQPVVPCLWL
jgi:hypothetical protein